MAFGTRAVFEPIREIAFGSIGATYTPVGGAITDHARLIRFVSTLDTEVYISLDAINDHIRLTPNGFFLIDLSSNKVRDDGLFLAIGTIFYIKEVVSPSSGELWIEVMSAQGGV